MESIIMDLKTVKAEADRMRLNAYSRLRYIARAKPAELTQMGYRSKELALLGLLETAERGIQAYLRAHEED
jgi:hypothetical protein